MGVVQDGKAIVSLQRIIGLFIGPSSSLFYFVISTVAYMVVVLYLGCLEWF